LNDGLVDTDRLIEAVASLDADVIAMQEVDRGQPRSGGHDQTAAVAEGLNAADYRFVPAVIGTPGEQWRPAERDEAISAPRPATQPSGSVVPGYGVSLISRLPVARWSTIVLPAAPVRAPVYIPGLRRWMLLRDEPRVVVVAELSIGITVASMHLSFVPGWNVRQIRTVTRTLGASPNTVLMGDANLPGGWPARASRWRAIGDGSPTFPSPRPRLRIDHVLVPQSTSLVEHGSSVHRLPISDHLAVRAEIHLPSP
jgi:endonuclease/exonuclease/phosphatase family metal-dependent hydrolase